MRIAVTGTGQSPDAPVDERFGRAPWLLIYDTETDDWTAVDNTTNRDAAHGAGIGAAESVARANAEVLLTGNCGPKAMDALTRAGIRVVMGQEGTARDAVQRFLGSRTE